MDFLSLFYFPPLVLFFAACTFFWLDYCSFFPLVWPGLVQSVKRSFIVTSSWTRRAGRVVVKMLIFFCFVFSSWFFCFCSDAMTSGELGFSRGLSSRISSVLRKGDDWRRVTEDRRYLRFKSISTRNSIFGMYNKNKGFVLWWIVDRIYTIKVELYLMCKYLVLYMK